MNQEPGERMANMQEASYRKSRTKLWDDASYRKLRTKLWDDSECIERMADMQ